MNWNWKYNLSLGLTTPLFNSFPPLIEPNQMLSPDPQHKVIVKSNTSKLYLIVSSECMCVINIKLFSEPILLKL